MVCTATGGEGGAGGLLSAHCTALQYTLAMVHHVQGISFIVYPPKFSMFKIPSILE